MSKDRPKSRRRKNRRRRKLTPIQKNDILVLKEMGHTYPEICEKTQLSYGTVAYTCQHSGNDPAEIKRIRGEALVRAAKDTFAQGLLAREAITPESLKQERIEFRDRHGNLSNVKLIGSSPLQNATIFGIMMDQAAKMAARGEDLIDSGQAPLDPTKLKGLISGLAGRISKLRIEGLEVEMVDGLQDRLSNLQDQAVNAEYVELQEE